MYVEQVVPDHTGTGLERLGIAYKSNGSFVRLGSLTVSASTPCSRFSVLSSSQSSPSLLLWLYRDTLHSCVPHMTICKWVKTTPHKLYSFGSHNASNPNN